MNRLDYEEDWLLVIGAMFGEKQPEGYECFWEKYWDKMCRKAGMER